MFARCIHAETDVMEELFRQQFYWIKTTKIWPESVSAYLSCRTMLAHLI